MKEIDFESVGGFCVGNAQNRNAMTGVTALVFTKKNKCGIDISGGGPAARESFLFSPLSYQQSVTALLLSGGSAYGLAAADGAMTFLEERRMGYSLGNIVVPIVPQSCIFDLGFGDYSVRPDAAMGREACKSALDRLGDCGAKNGNFGGGTGATVGKIFGMERAMKAGVGYAAFQVGELKLGAVVIVNALGDIYDYRNGKKIAGALDENRKNFSDTEEAMLLMQEKLTSGTNTTIGAVVTNGDLSQQDLCKVAAMTRSAYARCISPVGTMADGDTMYALSTGNVKTDVNTAGVLACKAVGEAIVRGVKSASMDDAEYMKYILHEEK